MTLKEFTIEAVLGDAVLRVAAHVDMVEEAVAHWNARLGNIAASREHVRQLVVSGLMEERYCDQGEAAVLASALIWLTITGPYGEKLLPFMKTGDMELRYEITRIDATKFNFHLSVDEKTAAALR